MKTEGQTVLVTGATGSGKTTTVDVILGLLEPQEGALTIDGQPITTDNRRQWQRVIGYVPQQIYLADDSVAANIAFGKAGASKQEIEAAARAAAAHERADRRLLVRSVVRARLPDDVGGLGHARAHKRA